MTPAPASASSLGRRTTGRIRLAGLLPLLVVSFLLPGRTGTGAESQAERPDSARKTAVLHGVVVDPAGDPVPGATVRATFAGGSGRATSDTAGAFVLPVPDEVDVHLAVRAPGFAECRLISPPAARAGTVRISLAVAPVVEDLVVTANRTETAIGSTAASVTVISSEALAASPALVLDDTLRQVPGFTLFRRTSSLAANPTSQGVSFRGLGASGASRALVLDDGVPLNDPFGGWVYWDRIPTALLDRVEMVRGGASDLYGSGAISGLVSLVRRETPGPFFRLQTSGGSMTTGQATMAGGVASGGWTITGGAEALTTGGYLLVAPSQRGRVDTRVSSRHLAVDVSLARRFSTSARAFFRGSLFGESRGNGTPLQTNDTRIGQVAGGADGGVAGGQLSFRADASRQTFNQAFSSISADRSVEQLVRLQHVPAVAGGASLQWARSVGRQVFVAGGDGREVHGTTRERLPAPGGGWRAPTAAGGTQRTGALFAADTLAVSSALSFTVSLRADWWRTSDAINSRAGRSERALSPRLGGVFRLGEHLWIVGSAYRAFRAPSLNELYRSFRLGNVLTLANDGLRAERVAGAEMGLRYAPAAPVLISGRVFDMRLDGAVANVTLESTPALITRQRRNLGQVTSRGLEVDAEARIPALALRASYLFDSPVVSSFPADARLEGRQVPQQPRHAATFGASVNRQWLGRVTADARWTSRQFDDDQNLLPLAPCFTMAAGYARELGPHLELLASGENLLNARCEVARTPVTLLGAPRAMRLGARLTWGRILH